MSFRRAILCALILIRLASGDVTADALFSEGMADANAGKLDAAAAVFQSGHKLYPRDARFLNELAGVEYLRKNNKAAKHWLLRAVKLNPNDNYADDFLGTLYQMDGNLAATLKYWNRVNKPFLTDVVFPASAALDPAFRARIFDFSAGQVFTLDRLFTTDANLDRAGVLATDRIDLLPAPGAQGYLATVDMQPLALPLTGWLGWTLPMLRELPYQGIDFDRYDIHGRGADLTSLWRWDPNKRRIDINWRAPVHGNPRSEYRTWVDARDEVWALPSERGLTVRSVAAGADYVTGMTERRQWTVGANFGRHTFEPGTLEPGMNVWQAMLDNRFDYALWRVPEHRLSVWSWAVFDAGRVFGRTGSRLLVTRGGLSGEWFPQAKGEKYRLTAQMQAGEMSGNVPVDELFQLGMDRDTERDLWLRGVLSAANGQKGTGLLGRDYAIAQTTFERQFFHIPFVTFSAGPFFDVGRAWNAGYGLRNYPVTYDTGVQVDVKTIGGVGLTIVYGRDLTSGRGAFYTAVSR